MHVEVRFDTPHRDATRVGDFAARRARFALRRLIVLNPSAQLKLSVVTGLQGPATRCDVRLGTIGLGAAAATAMARDWRVAVDDALMRAVRRLLRLWRRASHGHPSPRLSQPRS